jgi:hypothetical protein
VNDSFNPLVASTSSPALSILLNIAQKYQGGDGDGFSFNINNNQAINLIFPNGGELWTESSLQTILWSANGVNNVRIDYSTDNGSSWNLISANQPGNIGAFTWLVPPIVSQRALVRVSDVFNQSTILDVSNQVFSIAVPINEKHQGGSFDGHVFGVNSAPSLTVISPNGGDNWFEGQFATISWNSVGVTALNIDISTNNGSSWTSIATNIPTGTRFFDWPVTGLYGTNSCLIRVVDANNVLVRDSSDAVFSIPFFSA